LPNPQFTAKQINRTQTNSPKQGCNLHKFARKHKQKLWAESQKLNRTKKLNLGHIIYWMLGCR